MMMPVPAPSFVCSYVPPKKLCTSWTDMLVMETMDGITFSTTSDTSDVTTLDEVESDVPLLILSEDAVVVLPESPSPRIFCPTRFVVRNTALDTTPNRIANPVTAAAFTRFLCGFFSLRGFCCSGCSPLYPPGRGPPY